MIVRAEEGSDGDGGEERQADMSDEEDYLSQSMRNGNGWEKDESMIDDV